MVAWHSLTPWVGGLKQIIIKGVWYTLCTHSTPIHTHMHHVCSRNRACRNTFLQLAYTHTHMHTEKELRLYQSHVLIAPTLFLDFPSADMINWARVHVQTRVIYVMLSSHEKKADLKSLCFLPIGKCAIYHLPIALNYNYFEMEPSGKSPAAQ